MKPTYEEIETTFGEGCIKATYENGIILLIPKDEANSDYQAYLNKDKQQVEHLTEIIPADEA
jgi:hypothetical protein